MVYLVGDFDVVGCTEAAKAASNASETLDFNDATSSSFSSIKVRQRSRCF